MLTYNFTITGMSCGHCKRRVEDAVNHLSSVKEAIVSLEEGSLVIHSEAPIVIEEIIAAIDEAGYDAQLV
ncbi:cation transporter [Entomospira entomophila]|uniref:Heavy-metal-associated domain-containing protein n=1 Tax=Entomospira entomophila TaxID=2719988 RepID=A0A968KTS6_9SPIO|nr:cation transporter [Entomospira entomophilus]NIZ40651.1 heavy-metal-associated domain-containing protein [Entomospira entomophilus]WDI34865.1 cation transporter [Entomospira entomophilus]